MDRAIS